MQLAAPFVLSVFPALMFAAALSDLATMTSRTAFRRPWRYRSFLRS
jgi:hypothetical protein